VKCPSCGANNRANARFCARCRTPLAPAMTMKICPQCGQQNRVNARFCAQCGYTFATGVPSPGVLGQIDLSRRAIYAAGATAVVLGLLIVGVLIAGLASRRSTESLITATMARVDITPIGTRARPTSAPASPTLVPATATPLPVLTQPTSTPPPSEALDQALLATVQIIVPVDGQRLSSAGSGSVLTDKGHILTNFHVVGDPNTGRLYNREGVIYIAVSPPDLKGPPGVEYRAELVRGDQELDLALIRVSAMEDGGDLPANLGLTTVPVGDSDTVRIGDELSIIGFPGLGGDTVTFTKGSVSGFLTGEGWIKTDAEINAGNSGGAAIDRAGQLVGIPSEAATETVEVPGKIGLVRPVNLARPLIELALRDAGKQ
jgi:S1-C subfamily serine protease